MKNILPIVLLYITDMLLIFGIWIGVECRTIHFDLWSNCPSVAYWSRGGWGGQQTAWSNVHSYLSTNIFQFRSIVIVCNHLINRCFYDRFHVIVLKVGYLLCIWSSWSADDWLYFLLYKKVTEFEYCYLFYHDSSIMPTH